ncbi:hypothetical protein FQZ97_805760 [compost metagenome]
MSQRNERCGTEPLTGSQLSADISALKLLPNAPSTGKPSRSSSGQLCHQPNSATMTSSASWGVTRATKRASPTRVRMRIQSSSTMPLAAASAGLNSATGSGARLRSETRLRCWLWQ